MAHLATVAADGHPRVVPCCFAVDERDDVVYSAVDDVKPKSTMALRRLTDIAVHPDVAIVADHYSDDWSTLWWVRVRGVASVVDNDVQRARALGLLRAKYPQYDVRPPPGAVLAVAVTQWRWWPADD